MSLNIPTDEIRQAGAGLSDLSAKMASLSNRASSINGAVAACYMQGGIGEKVSGAATQMQGIASNVQQKSNVLYRAASLYEERENALLERSNQIASVIQYGYNVSWAASQPISGILQTSPPTETASSSGLTLEKVKSACKTIWNTGKKVAKTGAAVVSIATATAATVASWGVAGSTLGAGTAGAVLVTAYSVNTVSNRLTDIYNIWAGDETKVGTVNYMKSGAKKLGGNISEALGAGRDIGETIGNGIYTVGEFTSTVISAGNLSKYYGGGSKLTSTKDDFTNAIKAENPITKIDTYKQSSVFDVSHTAVNVKSESEVTMILKGSTGNSVVDTTVKGIKEIPTAIRGYTDIALHSDLGSLRYDTTLLGYEIENLKKCKTFVKATKEIVTMAYDFLEDIIYT